MREIFISKLVKEVLGPREGLTETLLNDPRGEYITGVLSPRSSVKAKPDPDADAELPKELVEGTFIEDDSEDEDVFAPPLLSPILDPKSLPYSIGLSFTLKGATVLPEIEILVTWARYYQVNSRGQMAWKRDPRFFLSGPIKVGGEEVTLLAAKKGHVNNRDEAEISIHLKSRKISNKVFYVNIYLVNEIRISGNYPKTEDHIFQPQIRVICLNGTNVVPQKSQLPQDKEELELDFLYRNKPVLAKGHLCSAIWKAVDPERPQPSGCSYREPPFYWVDGEALHEVDRIRFTRPDVRTEFIPVYPVESPHLAWDTKWGNSPELCTEVLAETWEPQDIKKRLNPLAEGYQRWIEQIRDESKKFPQEEQTVAYRVIQKCENILDRLRRGIELLIANEEVRLAFCFANKAMEIQSRWSKNEPLKWYPFQLAFILTTLESVIDPSSRDRNICDLLWVPTGAGKTEAYLAIAALVMAYRRRMALTLQRGDRTGGGVAVIMRYTLRLLTIQQFRRALRMVTACEYLRVHGLASKTSIGWRPLGCQLKENFLWGSARFSIGLWVGGGVTPNNLSVSWIGHEPLPGAIEILRGQTGEGEPAQVLNCPACDAILSVPEMGLQPGTHILHFVLKLRSGSLQRFRTVISNIQGMSSVLFRVKSASIHSHVSPSFFTLTIELSLQKIARSSDVDEWWKHIENFLKRYGIQVELQPIRASRLGYFIISYRTKRNTMTPVNFAIHCPNPSCELNYNVSWVEGVPLEESSSTVLQLTCGNLQTPEGLQFRRVLEFTKNGSDFISDRVPIPALTVDEQIYHHPPSFLVATVDKFARLPFQPKCAAIFGNVVYYHARFGYYRPWQIPSTAGWNKEHPPGVGRNRPLHIGIQSFKPPDLIIQDELHLIEGPLGSMVGIYETAIDHMCRDDNGSAKYIASTATIRQAEEQVRAVFMRRLIRFPPHGLIADDMFFLRFEESHPMDDLRPGRLYAGICAPGRGPLTPIVRIWARLLQTTFEQSAIHRSRIDPFWTLTGYFNSIRELAGARALYRQDIPERLNRIGGNHPRAIPEESSQELSSRTNSTDLPSILNILNSNFSGNTTNPNSPDALFTTSMFGTGVDIPRLGLMIVHGQPKTSSAYIQSTGRVGRRSGALVIIFYRATRPRDLSHYELFCGYHGALHRFVEPITVAPFSPGALDKAAGPVAVGILRNIRGTTRDWWRDDSSSDMATYRNASEVVTLPDIFEDRAQQQPHIRKPQTGRTNRYVNSELDRWKQIAHQNQNYLKYVEYLSPQNPVVLGDPPHQHKRLPIVYENAPQSLRDVEETTSFQVL
jgi:hypothetical protein